MSLHQHHVGQAGTVSIAMMAAADDTDPARPCLSMHGRRNYRVTRLSCLQRRQARCWQHGRRFWQRLTWRTLWKPCGRCRCAVYSTQSAHTLQLLHATLPLDHHF